MFRWGDCALYAPTRQPNKHRLCICSLGSWPLGHVPRVVRVIGKSVTQKATRFHASPIVSNSNVCKVKHQPNRFVAMFWWVLCDKFIGTIRRFCVQWLHRYIVSSYRWARARSVRQFIAEPIDFQTTQNTDLFSGIVLWRRNFPCFSPAQTQIHTNAHALYLYASGTLCSLFVCMRLTLSDVINTFVIYPTVMQVNF